jgi:cation/acetate symporter
MRLVLAAGDFNTLAVSVFAVVLAITLLITRWAARRTRTATEFWAAGRGISGTQNGFAIAGDYLSASTFLGYAGLIFLFGFDGWIIGLAALVSFLPVLYLLAERMRNSGKYTVADVLSYRLQQRPVRAAAAVTTLFIAGIYLVAQLVGAGALLQALAGINFAPAVLLCGVFMVIYVAFGGMLGTTWVQIVKAAILMFAGLVLTVAVLAKFSFNPSQLFDKAAANHESGRAILGPGLYLDSPLLVISTGLTIFLGTAGLPHILMRFFTVPDANEARKSVLCTIGFIGVFTLLVPFLGFGAIAVLGAGATEAVGPGGNLAAPLLAEELGGGAGTAGGDIALALFASAAFATILAVVAGLVIAAAGAVAHDLWANVLRRSAGDGETTRAARFAAVGVGVMAIVATLLVGSGFNVTVLVALAFVFSASANFPALLLALAWRRFNTVGALTGVAFGLVASFVFLALSPPIWPGPDSEGSPSPLIFPAIWTVPIGFLGCWLGTMLSSERVTERSYDELLVRSELGLGAENGGPVRGSGRFRRPARAASAAARTTTTT